MLFVLLVVFHFLIHFLSIFSSSEKDYFHEGLPPYRLSGNEPVSSISDKHGPVTKKTLNFPLFSRAVKIPSYLDWKLIETIGSHSIQTEGGAGHLIRNALLHAVTCISSLRLTLSPEQGILNTRPDFLILTLDEIPVGVVEVKKPQDRHDSEENERRMLGQLFDYMMILRATFNLSHVIGIFSRYSDWYFCSLDENLPLSELDNSSGTASPRRQALQFLPQTPVKAQTASATSSTPQPNSIPEKNFNPPPYSKTLQRGSAVFSSALPSSPSSPSSSFSSSSAASSCSSTAAASSCSSTAASFSSSPFTLGQEIERELFVSRKYSYNDRDLWSAILSALTMMMNIKHEQTDEYRYVAVVGERIPGFTWHYLRTPIRIEQLNFNITPQQTAKKFYSWEHLGHGASGRAFLVSTTKTLAVGVLKCFFASSDADATNKKVSRLQNRDQEWANWQKIYGDNRKDKSLKEYSCHKVVAFSRPCIVMPYFAPILVDDRHNQLNEIRNALQKYFVNQGYIHEDVRWRNIGKDCNGKVVIFDLGQIKVEENPKTLQAWLENSMEYLRSKASPNENSSSMTKEKDERSSLPSQHSASLGLSSGKFRESFP